MEYTQWAIYVYYDGKKVRVLILVVMEYTQWEKQKIMEDVFLSVLILVVMEYTQWEQNNDYGKRKYMS